MTTLTGKISGIAASTSTQALVRDTLQQTPAAARPAVRDLFARAAGSDRNRHLSLDEAQLVQAAVTAQATPGSDAPAAPDLGALRAAVDAQLALRTQGQNLDGIKSYFTSTTKNLAPVLIQSMRDTVAAAQGRPVELHAMIFAFTEKSVADEMLALAKANPNVEIRIVTDFAQLTTSGDRQAARIHYEAIAQGFGDRVSVKFKKDTPYTWSTSAKRPVYTHALSKGLNHHKGLVALVDGKPHALVTGSYNWSKSGSDSNYESLFVIDATNPGNRPLISDYQAEFAAFFNHPDTLGVDGTKAFKAQLFDELRVAHGLPPEGTPGPIPAGPVYAPRAPAATFDVNHLSDANHAALTAVVKDSSVVGSIVHQYATYGAFTGWDNLVERVPGVAKLAAAKQDALKARLEFGEGSVQLHSASASELVRSLKITPAAAQAIVAERQVTGGFERVDQLRGLPGISDAVYARIAPRLTDDIGRAFFSAKAVSDATAKTGYAPVNATKLVPVLDADLDGVTLQPATLSSGVIDLVRRAKPGETMKIAQYGLSISTQEYSEIIDAAGRGVKFKIVLDKAGNAAAAAALQAQANAGLPIEVRVQKRTMHQKFGTLNDDTFFGSSNFSGSASSKNSEDRFVVKNNPELALELSDEHDRVWSKSDAVA